jgi:copper transport protein
VTAVTGLYAAGLQVASVDALVTTLYGRTLIAKAALVCLASMLGAANFALLRLVGRSRSLLRMTIVGEAAVGVGVLLAAGVLTSAAPARGPQFAPQRPVVAAIVARQIEDIVVTASVRPNRPGLNVINVVAASTRRPEPAPIRAVSVALGGGRVPLKRVGGHGWLGTVSLQRPGAARMTVIVRRSGRELAAPVGWTVERTDPARAVVVSSRKLSTIVDPAALVVLLAAAVTAAASGFARERRAARRRLLPSAHAKEMT